LGALALCSSIGALALATPSVICLSSAWAVAPMASISAELRIAPKAVRLEGLIAVSVSFVMSVCIEPRRHGYCFYLGYAALAAMEISA
jgi:hypothetical protein